MSCFHCEIQLPTTYQTSQRGSRRSAHAATDVRDPHAGPQAEKTCHAVFVAAVGLREALSDVTG